MSAPAMEQRMDRAISDALAQIAIMREIMQALSDAADDDCGVPPLWLSWFAERINDVGDELDVSRFTRGLWAPGAVTIPFRDPRTVKAYADWLDKLGPDYRAALNEALDELTEIHAEAEAERIAEAPPQWLESLRGRTPSEQAVTTAIMALSVRTWGPAKNAVNQICRRRMTVVEGMFAIAGQTGLSGADLAPLEIALGALLLEGEVGR